MNGFIRLGGGLEMLVINRIDFNKDQEAIATVQEGENLQRQVFRENNVSFLEDRVLLAVDSVGGPDVEPQLDGSSKSYHHLYLLHQGRLIGMRVTEEFDKVPGMDGNVVLDYLPPLVPQAEAGKTYELDRLSPQTSGSVSNMLLRIRLARGEKRTYVPLQADVIRVNPFELLTNFSLHHKHPFNAYVATFSDGIGVSNEQLQINGYVKSEAGIWVPPMSAGSHDLADTAARTQARKDYMTVLPEPVHMVAKFVPNAKPQIPGEAAEWLFVTKYLKDGYIDTGHLRKIELRDRKQIIAEQGSITEEQLMAVRLRINELPSVVRTRESIAEAAGKKGYVAFWPISPAQTTA